MTVKELLNMPTADILNLSDIKEIRGIANTLASATNKRIRRLEKEGLISPAVQSVEETQGIPRFSTRDKSDVELKEMIRDMRKFLSRQTGSVKGAKQWRDNVIKGMQKQGIDISKDEFNNFFRAYRQLYEINPNMSTKIMKYNVYETINVYMQHHPNKPISEVLQIMMQDINAEYEKQALEMAEMKGTSDFFQM